MLQRGGADVVSTGNLNSTQQETCDYLRERGLTVIGGPTADPAEHDRNLRGVLETEPDLLLDNGGDLFSRYLEAPWDGLRGGTEETTSGRDRLLPLRDRIAKPLLVINDSPIKQFAENTHAVGPGTVEAFMRITNRITNGRHVTVFGYGSVGRGVAMYFRNFFSVVSVVEPQPVLQLRAVLDGMIVPGREAAVADADVIVTVTGAPGVVTAADLAHAPRRRGADERRAPAVGDRRARHDGRSVGRLGGGDDRRDHDAAPRATAARSTCSPAATWSTSRGRGRSATRSSRWTSASRCRRAASRRSRPAPSTRRRASCPCRPRSTTLVASTYVALVDGGRHSSSSSAP